MDDETLAVDFFPLKKNAHRITLQRGIYESHCLRKMPSRFESTSDLLTSSTACAANYSLISGAKIHFFDEWPASKMASHSNNSESQRYLPTWRTDARHPLRNLYGESCRLAPVKAAR